MAKKVLTMIKLQIPGGQANPAPPVGPALGQHGVNIMEFCKAFNAQTQAENGRIIPVEITVFEDRSFTFITKTPPAAVLIKEALYAREGLRRAEPREGRPPEPGAAPPDRRGEDAGSERARRRAGDEGHRRDGALDGSGGAECVGSTEHSERRRRRLVRRRSSNGARQDLPPGARRRSTASRRIRRPMRSSCSRTCRERSSTRRSRCISAWVSTSAMRISNSVGR